MKLSILIPTLPERQDKLDELLQLLRKQTHILTTDYTEGEDYFIRREYNPLLEILILSDKKKYSIGWKRNKLLKEAEGEYIAFVDDDDLVSDNYITLLMEGINKGVDGCSLLGEYYVDGVFDGFFEHSIRYNAYKTTDNKIKYERYNNHLNCIKTSIAKKFKFPEKNHGEDTDWATQIFKSGLIKTEHYISEVIYYYNYVSKK